MKQSAVAPGIFKQLTDKGRNLAPEGRERRCPRLGHEVTFAYCLKSGEGGRPCWKTIDCWWELFDVVAYLKKNYSEEAVVELLTARPPSKIASLVELVDQARQRLNKK